MSDDARQAQSLIPYERWTDDSLREVVARALELAASEGLPGEHHYYLTFRTDHAGTRLPGHLKARYPQEMTVVLQHQFEALKVDRVAGTFSVRLYFGGVPATLVVPFAALTGFADPSVRYGLRFQPVAATSMATAGMDPVGMAPNGLAPTGVAAQAQPAEPAAPAEDQGSVVRLDAFRRRPARE